MREYRIYGLQRSGTYYLEFLIKANLDIKCGNKGKGQYWKHNLSIPKDVDLDKETFFPIYKNPYTWAESIITKNVDFVRRQTTFPIMQNGPDADMCNGFNVRNMAKTYKLWCDNWIYQLPDEYQSRCFHIQYEDLLETYNRELKLEEIAFEFDIDRLDNSKFINPRKVTLSSEFTEDSYKKYTNFETKLLSRDNMDVMNDVLGERLFKNLGYNTQ